MLLSRRGALSVGGVAGLLLLGVGAARLRSLGPVQPHGDFLVIGRTEQRVLEALTSALFPKDGALPGGLDLGVVRDVDEQLWAAQPSLRAEVLSAILLVEYVPPVFGRWGKFTALSNADRAAVFEAMLRSKRDLLAQVAVGLRQILSIIYYAKPATWTVIGYDGPWIKKAKPPPSAIRYVHLVKTRREEQAP